MIRDFIRQKKLEKEAKEQGLKSTKELKVDESLLSEEEKGHTEIPWTGIIIIGVLAIIVIGLMIAVFVTR